jgi:NADPH:quinone reductase
MRGFTITALTGPGAGRVSDDVPEPVGAHPWSDGERLLIEVRAAGVAYPDVLQSRGEYQHGTAPPYVSGGEVAGLVLEAPPGSRFAAGDRVAGLTVWGAMAERVLGLPQYTVKIPDGMSYVDGAAVYLNYATAWFALYRLGFAEGETALVHGAAGGVGTATLQMLRAKGGRSIAVVSTEHKAQVAHDSGANSVVFSTGSWLDEVRELTNGCGVDIVIDPVGGDRFTDSLRSLDVGGRLAVVGFAGGSIPTVKVNRLLLRDLSVVGVALEAWARRQPEFMSTLAAALEAHLAAGDIKPVVGDVVSLDEGGRALHLIEGRAALGKVVVDVNDGHGTR